MKRFSQRKLKITALTSEDSSDQKISSLTFLSPKFRLTPPLVCESRENIIQLCKVQDHLRELHVLTKEASFETLPNKNQSELFSSIIAVTDKIFSYYNIKINVITNEESDSALYITAATSSKLLSRMLYSIADLLSKLPFTFVRTIGLTKFTLCGKISLLKEEYRSIMDTRINSNAMFPIYDLKTFDQVEKHFYRILLSKIQSKDGSLESNWPSQTLVKLPPLSSRKSHEERFLFNFKTKEDGRKMSCPLNGIVPKVKHDEQDKSRFTREKQKKQIDALVQLLNGTRNTSPGTSPKDLKAFEFLKERMESIDSQGFNREWWGEISRMSTPKSSILFLEDSLFN